MTFSDRLDALIKERKTTQKALAEYAGVRYASISDWKKDGSFPRADIALKMATYLGTTVEFLIAGEQPAKPDVAEALRHAEAVKDFLSKL